LRNGGITLLIRLLRVLLLRLRLLILLLLGGLRAIAVQFLAPTSSLVSTSYQRQAG